MLVGFLLLLLVVDMVNVFSVPMVFLMSVEPAVAGMVMPPSGIGVALLLLSLPLPPMLMPTPVLPTGLLVIDCGAVKTVLEMEILIGTDRSSWDCPGCFELFVGSETPAAFVEAVEAAIEATVEATEAIGSSESSKRSFSVLEALALSLSVVTLNTVSLS